VDEPNTAVAAGAACFAWNWKAGLLPQAPEQLPDPHPAWPFGEPSFAREFRNISRYRSWVFRRCRRRSSASARSRAKHRAILLTRALDGWDDLDSLLQRWSELSEAQHSAILQACGHWRAPCTAAPGARLFLSQAHFLQATGDGYQAQLIDLEKTRPLLFGMRDRVKDLEPLLRRAPVWSEAQVRELLAAYLDQRRTVRWSTPGCAPDRAPRHKEPADAFVRTENAGRSPSLPLSIAWPMPPAGRFAVAEPAAGVAGQRYVGAGIWRGRPVLAKLLVGSKAARHFQRELAGVRLLAEQGLTTPLLLADGLRMARAAGCCSIFSKAPKASMMPGSGRTPAVLADEQSAVLAEALARSAKCTARACGRKTCTWTTCCASGNRCT
jgi:hypothetical protein